MQLLSRIGFVCALVLFVVGCSEQDTEALSPFAEAELKRPLNVMTYNIRYNNPADSLDAWPNRVERVAGLMRFHQADVIGIQEALRGQLDDLQRRLPNHRWVGVGRDDGADGGEFSPIFYNQFRLKLLDHGTFWLSETPEVPGSIGWDAAITRVATWAQFEFRPTNDVFWVFNAHFDHRGETARNESAALLRDQANALAGDAPVIITGDFNFTPDAQGYAALTTGEKPLWDTRTLSTEPYGPEGTWAGFAVQSEPLTRRIDYIFMRAHWIVYRYGVLAEQEGGRYPSDHLPVLVTLGHAP